MTKNLKIFIAGILAIFLYLNLLMFQKDIDRIRKKIFIAGERPLVFPKASVVRLASLGHKNLLADYYWLKEIQYIGKCMEEKIKPFQTYRYADFITDIDPYFFEVYYFSSAIMIFERITPDENIKLLEKGKKYLPNKKQIPFHLGFVYYYFKKNYEKAAENLELAAKISGQLIYAIFAARIRAEKGNLELGAKLIKEMLKDPRAKRWREGAIQFLKGIDQKRILNMLNQKISEYYKLYGRYPERLEELVKMGLLSQIPQDPAEGEFYIDPITHQAKSTKEIYLGVYKPPEWMEQ